MKSTDFLTFLLIFLIPVFGNSQIEKVIDQYKAYTPSISDANKIKFFPEIIDSTVIEKEINYSIFTKPLFVNCRFDPITPARIEGEPLTKLYRSYIKLGFGNYITPLAEIYYNSIRSKDFSYGLYYNHLSSLGNLKIRDSKIYSGYNDNYAGIYGKKFLQNKKTIGGSIDAGRNSYYYYGYTPLSSTLTDMNKEDLDKQNVISLKSSIYLKNNYSDSLHTNFETNFNYNFLQDYYKLNEQEFQLVNQISKFYGDELFGLTGDIAVYNTNLLSDTITNGIIQIKPWASIVGDEWRIEAGLNFTADAYSDSISYHIYPKVQLQYNVVDNFLIPYVGYSGFLQNNNYRFLLTENPYISQGTNISKTNHLIVLYGGLKGNFSKSTSYNFKASYSVIENMLFFVNDTGHIQTLNRFSTIFDDVELTELHGEVVYKKSDEWNFIMKGNYFLYTLKTELRAWNKPDYDLSLTAKYNLKDKILISAEIFGAGTRYTKVYMNNSEFTEFALNSYIDANINIEYRYSKILSAFVYVNNITSSNYRLWYGYPVQGINFIFGLTYSL
ncbi:MAG: TonB-dependent receptor [Bacteroidota bacterium]